jgi:hypothetical protein
MRVQLDNNNPAHFMAAQLNEGINAYLAREFSV